MCRRCSRRPEGVLRAVWKSSGSAFGPPRPSAAVSADLDSGLRRNDEQVKLAVGGLRVSGVRAGAEMRKGTDALPVVPAQQRRTGTSPPARRTGTAKASTGGRSATCDEDAADAVCPDRRVLRRWAWVLDSGLRRNDERGGTLRWAGFGPAALVQVLRCAKALTFQPVVPAQQAEDRRNPPARRTGTAAEDSRQRLNFVVPAKAGCTGDSAAIMMQAADAVCRGFGSARAAKVGGLRVVPCRHSGLRRNDEHQVITGRQRRLRCGRASGWRRWVRALRCPQRTLVQGHWFRPSSRRAGGRKRRTQAPAPASPSYWYGAEDSRQRLNFVVPAKAGTQCGV